MRTLRRIGGPQAITVWTLLLPGAMWPVIAWSDPDLGGSLPEWAVIGGLALAAAGAVLGAARLTILPCRERSSRPVLALATFAVAGLAHGTVSSVLARDWGIETEIAPARILLRAALAVLWMSVIAIAVDEIRRHRVVMRTLQHRLAELREVERVERERFDQLARELRADAVAPVLGALERIRAALVASDVAGGEREAALRLGEVIAKQVRPLSHALLDVAPGWAPPAVLDEPVPWSRRLSRIITTAFGTPSHHPWLAAIIYEASVTPLLLVSDVPRSVIVVNALGATVLLGGVSILGNRLVGSRLARIGSAGRLAVAIGVSIAAVLVANAGFALLTSLLAGGALLYPATIATFPILVLIINIASGVGVDRREEEQRLEAITQQLEWATARIVQRVRHERHVLGAWLHGPTQSSLLSVATRIERADDASRAAAITAALPDLAVAIEAVQELVEGVAESPTRDAEAIRDLARMWEGVIDVQLELPPATLAAFESDPSAHATIVDLLAEALANAVRHGGAGTALVRIDTIDQPDRLWIEVADDGVLLDDAEPGMGSRLLDAVTLRWTLQSRDDGWTLLTAEIPYAPAAALAPATSAM